MRASNVAPKPFQVSDADRVYISLVRDKFKDAQVQLIEHLGESNWQRHINVRLRMEDIRNDVEEECVREDLCSTSRPYPAFHDSAKGTSIPA